MEAKHTSLVGSQYKIPFILVTSLFFLWGFAHAILDVLNKHFQEVLDISKAHSAFVQVTMYMGYFIMAIPAGLFISRYDYRKGVVFGLLLYGIGAFLFVPGQYLSSFNVFLFALFVIGCGLTFLETAANPYVTELGAKETAASRLNLAQSFNGLGAMCAPIVGGWLIFRDNASVALPYMGLGIFVLLAAVVFTRVRLPEIHEDDSAAGSAEKAKNASLARNFAFIFGVFALFCYEISEISINSFFINYATDGNWFDKPTATTLLSLGGLMLFMVGRVVGSLVMGRVKAETVLAVCATATVVTTTIVVADCGAMSMGALIAGYFFESIMFPTIFALSLRGLGEKTKRASSFLMMTPVGGAVGPWLMGWMADAHGMVLSFVVPLAGFVVVWIYSIFTLKNSKQ